jgi:hypothetical protein
MNTHENEAITAIEDEEKSERRETEAIVYEQIDDMLILINNITKLIYNLKAFCDPVRLELEILNNHTIAGIKSNLFPTIQKENRNKAHTMATQVLRGAIKGMANGAKPVIERHIDYLKSILLLSTRTLYHLHADDPKAIDALTKTILTSKYHE